MSLLVSLSLAGCGGGGTTQAATTPVAAPRPGGAVNLLTLPPANANVVLRADLSAVRQDPARYAEIASQLVAELGLGGDASTVRPLLDRTDEALGVFAPGAGTEQEGMLILSGRYGGGDFEQALGVATRRHGSSPAPQATASGGQLYALGDATLVKLDDWTWAIAIGAGMRAHLAQVALSGGARFSHDLIEFGPRIALPTGGAQAWANQDSQVGVDMVALVFAGDSPQMVHNFVATVGRHLSL